MPAIEEATRASSDKVRTGGELSYAHRFTKATKAGIGARYIQTSYDNVNWTDEESSVAVAVSQKLHRHAFAGASAERKVRTSDVVGKGSQNNTVMLQLGVKF